MGTYKSKTDRRYLKQASLIAYSICEELLTLAQPDTTTMTLEEKGNELLRLNRSTAPFKNFDNFGFAICVSLNAEIVNGPPSEERVIQDGDLISIALGTEHRGFYGKVAQTSYVGKTPPPPVENLIKGTQAVFGNLEDAHHKVTSVNDVIDIIVETAINHSLKTIQYTGGSSIGKSLHEWPPLPNKPEELKEKIALIPGMTLNVMPMFTLGDDDQYIEAEDGWTRITNDNALSAHFAETLIMTEDGLKILRLIEEFN